MDESNDKQEHHEQRRPDNDNQRQRDPAAEALFGLALAAGIGIFAIPFTISLVIRLLLGVLTFVLVFYSLARFPSISRATRWLMLKTGPVLLILLAVALVVLLIHPSIHPSAFLVRLIIAGATALASSAIYMMRYVLALMRQYRGDQLSFRLIAIYMFIAFWIGVLGCLLIRSMPGGIQVTNVPLGAAMAGFLVFGVFRNSMSSPEFTDFIRKRAVRTAERKGSPPLPPAHQ